MAATNIFAQDTGTQQQIDKLSGSIQDLQAALEQQTKKIAALEQEISELRDKVNTPPVSDSPSREDLKNLAEKVQEVDKKRQADRELILKEIDKIAKAVAAGPAVKTKTKTTSTSEVAGGAGDAGTTPAPPQKGYYYTVQPKDTLPAIAKAYREKGVHVTTAQILKANPGLDASKILVDQKIFIPDPNAK